MIGGGGFPAHGSRFATSRVIPLVFSGWASENEARVGHHSSCGRNRGAFPGSLGVSGISRRPDPKTDTPVIMQDRRNAGRKPLILAAEVVEVDSGARLSARTSDVSRTGCYIDTLNPTPTGTVVRVKLAHDGEEIDLLARIVYVSPRLGMGVRFDESITPEQLAVLDRWLAD